MSGRGRQRGRTRRESGVRSGADGAGDAGGGNAARGQRAGRAGRAGRTGRAEPVPELCECSPFAVFCAFWLGITECDGYREQSRRDVAKRFGLAEAELDEYLAEHDLTRTALDAARFDLASARLDAELAPAGISRLEVARVWWGELGAGGSGSRH